jgi:hypothetical protein
VDGILVVDDEAEMTAIVRGLPSPRLERQELIAEVDEGRTLAPTSQLEVEQAAVERERLVDISDSSAIWFRPMARALFPPGIAISISCCGPTDGPSPL